MRKDSKSGIGTVKLALIAYDVLLWLLMYYLLFNVYQSSHPVEGIDVLLHLLLSGVCIFAARTGLGIYRQIWRYGGIQSYIRLLVADLLGCALYVVVNLLLPARHTIAFARVLSICSMNALLALGMRMVYRYCFKCGRKQDRKSVILRAILKFFSFNQVEAPVQDDADRIRVAIYGANRVGVGLAGDFLEQQNSPYIPCCFIDQRVEMKGREILNLPVLHDDGTILSRLEPFWIQEIIFAIPDMDEAEKRAVYERFRTPSYLLKRYDYPTIQTAGGKRMLQEIDVQELLFRSQVQVVDELTHDYYHGAVVMVTGGGGSIGSEIARQLAPMGPKRIILLDIYENGAYDVQQELRSLYPKIPVDIEIVSITNRDAIERVFQQHHPEIVIHAAAHKHVPLMEHNCVEAVENNVFGTRNVVEMCEKYRARRFMMVSTDKAVNPTNVMGATKRMCEMLVLAHSKRGNVRYSVTRFGNVLGSAGSVIPMFKRQIAAGGPVTITDKRIIRYFMTIPEASQLVLCSGAMAKNGELFVLDMGKPVKIFDLAMNLIRLSGLVPFKDIDIVEIGLRPGEKLYEELLMDSETLTKTPNSLIFIEKDEPISLSDLEKKCHALEMACWSGNDDRVREMLKAVVPTYRSPEEVNRAVGA